MKGAKIINVNLSYMKKEKIVTNVNVVANKVFSREKNPYLKEHTIQRDTFVHKYLN